MNKKAILLIIGLMSAALLGIGWLQVNWIRFAIDLNEKRFDQMVRDALTKVVDMLEQEEQLEAISYINGYSTNYYEQEGKTENGQTNRSKDNAVGTIQTPTSPWTAPLENDCDCYNCQKERYNQLTQLARYNQKINDTPIAERINPETLNSFLEQELMKRGIMIDYDFGVYANDAESFVIIDDHYVVEDDASTRNFLPSYSNLYTSKYNVYLFPKDKNPEGTLMIHFPSKASIVWGGVWKNLLGSILFTGVILFCFCYTIMVVFRQKKLSEMKTDFINNMTHEFKTPIATISLAADSINSPMISGKPDKVRRFAGIIKQENRRMNAQVEKVLQMALLDKKDFSLKLTSINMHDVIKTAIENINLQVEKKDGKAWAELQASNPTIEGDVTHVSNVVNNLLDNANKYSPEKPEISVHTRNVANGVEVIVQDKGMGMTKEARKHIFDKFYRVHTGDIHDVKGFGLGLSYVKAMMNAHKGTIDVKSELGKGSSFVLFFPFRVED